MRLENREMVVEMRWDGMTELSTTLNRDWHCFVGWLLHPMPCTVRGSGEARLGET